MSSFDIRVLTNTGATLSSKTLTGESLTFTRVAIGDGSYVGEPQSLIALVNEKVSLDIKGIQTQGDEVVISTTLLPGALIDSFYYRELGVYAKGEDGVETLYFYASSTNPSYLDKTSLDEQKINIGLIVANTSSVTAIIDTSLVYVTQAELEAHNADTNAHTDIRAAIQNIDLTSVTNHVTAEHDLTKARITYEHTNTKTHVTAECAKVSNVAQTQATDIKNHVTSEHNSTRSAIDTLFTKISNALKTISDDIVNRLKGTGGDFAGKTFAYEEVSIPQGSTKTYTNSKGGLVIIKPRITKASTITIVVDGVTIVNGANLKKLFYSVSEYDTSLTSSSNKNYTSVPLNVPFKSSFSITVSSSDTSTIEYDLIYYLNS